MSFPIRMLLLITALVAATGAGVGAQKWRLNTPVAKPALTEWNLHSVEIRPQPGELLARFTVKSDSGEVIDDLHTGAGAGAVVTQLLADNPRVANLRAWVFAHLAAEGKLPAGSVVN